MSTPDANPPRRAPIVRCPTCGGDSVFDPSNAWRPFCSQRCKGIDLGAWASERYRVAGPSASEPQPGNAADADGAYFGERDR